MIQEFHFWGHAQKNWNGSLCPHVCSSISHKRQHVEATQVSSDRWIDKHNVICTYNGTLFSLYKEGNSDTRYHMGELCGCYAEWHKAVINRKIWYDSTHLRDLRRVKFIKTESGTAVAQAGGGAMGRCPMGAGLLVWQDEKTPKPGHTTMWVHQHHWTAPQKVVKMVNLISILPDFYKKKQWFSAWFQARCLKGDARSWWRAGFALSRPGSGY